MNTSLIFFTVGRDHNLSITFFQNFIYKYPERSFLCPEWYFKVIIPKNKKQTKQMECLLFDKVDSITPVVSKFTTELTRIKKHLHFLVLTIMIKSLKYRYSNAKLEATNKLIKDIKRLAFGFRNFKNFKTKILIALNFKKERTNLILSRSSL